MLCWLASEAGNVSTGERPATTAEKTMTLPAGVRAAAASTEDDANLQRTQSARFPPDKRLESKSTVEPLDCCRLLVSMKHWPVSA